MLRRLTLFIVSVTCACTSQALTLGSIETTSALYEKFAAQIPIEQALGEDLTDLQVALASPADFQRMGVERSFFLTQLEFEVVSTGGKPRIDIRSQQPLSEPYIDFVINVVWRQGRMLKEYIVLLDPPGLGQTVTKRTATARTAPTETTPSPARTNEPAQRTYGPTKRNDTMWSIATRTRPTREITIEQHMLAIKRLNPGAFINDNINLLKVGQMLKIPGTAETAMLSRQAARRQVADEVDAWQANKPAPMQAAASPPAGQLRIVAADGDRAGGIASESVQSQVRTNADAKAAAQRTANAVDRQLQSLEQVAERRLAVIRERSEAQNEALKIKDQQLAELQSQVLDLQREMNRLLAANPPARSAAQPAALASTSPLLWLGALLALLLALVWLLRRRSDQDAGA